jgi:hypothetical protein
VDVLGLGLSARELADIDFTLGILFFLQAGVLFFAGLAIMLSYGPAAMAGLAALLMGLGSRTASPRWSSCKRWASRSGPLRPELVHPDERQRIVRLQFVPAIKIGHRLVPGESARIGSQINPDALASFSVENLFNQQYSRYLDVAPSPGHGLNSTPLPFFSPGITVKGALTVRFSDLTLFGG